MLMQQFSAIFHTYLWVGWQTQSSPGKWLEISWNSILQARWTSFSSPGCKSVCCHEVNQPCLLHYHSYCDCMPAVTTTMINYICHFWQKFCFHRCLLAVYDGTGCFCKYKCQTPKNAQTFSYWFFTSPVRAVAKYCDECICVSACLSVCLSDRISLEPRAWSLPIFLCVLPRAVARFSFGTLTIGCIAYWWGWVTGVHSAGEV